MFSISCQQVDLSEYYVYCISITVSMSTLVAPAYLQWKVKALQARRKPWAFSMIVESLRTFV